MRDGTREHFEALFAGDNDPWGYRHRWYEQRKRALTLAALPAPRYRAVLELGCANGELAADLAPRCDRLLALDGIARAVTLASARLAAFTHASVRQAWLPDEWSDVVPGDDRFDLVILSETGFYFGATALDTLADHMAGALAPGGTVLACHWRSDLADCPLNGDAVHDRLATQLGLPLLLRMSDADLRLDVWCADPRSVATREGLRVAVGS